MWTNYKRDPNTWQGALEFKETYMRWFLGSSDEQLLDGSYDTSKLSNLLDVLLAKANLLLGAQAREP